VRPHADDLYLGVTVAIVVGSAVVATMFVRRFVRRPRVGGAVVAVMVLVVLAPALVPRRVSEIAARDVRSATERRDEQLHPSSPTVPGPAPAMRQVPIATTGVPPTQPVSGAPRGPSEPRPPPAQPPSSPPAPTSTSGAPIVLPPVPTTVTVTTAPVDDTSTTTP